MPLAVAGAEAYKEKEEKEKHTIISDIYSTAEQLLRPSH